jgi:S-adenosylmethionine decarboxylase proenzyme
MTSSSSTSRSSQNEGHTLDIRLYLCALVSGMVLAFGAGVFYGPTPTFLPASTMTIPSAEVTPLSTSERVDSKQILSHRRYPATHSAELGKIKQVHVNVGQVPSFEELDGAVLDRRNFSAPLDAAALEQHEPAGQHLLVDIKNVNAEFLNSEERLAKAMVEVVTEAKLTLLSYHCHSLEPAGVSCVGVLLESHISFHTWPEEGVITLDLFTCGPNNLMPVVPKIEKLFGVPRENSTEPVGTMWSHELRGFRSHEARKAHYLDLSSDLSWYVTSPLEMLIKNEVSFIGPELCSTKYLERQTFCSLIYIYIFIFF